MKQKTYLLPTSPKKGYKKTIEVPKDTEVSVFFDGCISVDGFSCFTSISCTNDSDKKESLEVEYTGDNCWIAKSKVEE